MGTLWTRRTAICRDPGRLGTERTGSISGNGQTAGELRLLDPQLAGLYERGLALARKIDEPGNAYLVAHAGRELSRGVLQLLLRDEGLEIPAEDFEKAPLNERNRPPIAKALRLETDDPRVDEWFHLVQQFSNTVHWQFGGPQPTTVREAYERFTSLLYGRVAPYYVTEAELDALLEIKTPTREHAKRLRHLQLRLGQRNYFFRQLRNPAWVECLAAEGFFKSPPGRQVDTDGSWSARPWPEGNYLVLAATEKPAAVVEVLTSIPLANDNPVVWEIVAKAGRQLPPEMAVRIVPRLTTALKTVPARMFSESVVDFIVVLAETGQAKEAFTLAAFLLRVVDPSEVEELEGLRFRPRTEWVFPRFRSHDYAELLGCLVDALEALDATRTLEFLLSKVRRVQRLVDHRKLNRRWRLVDTDSGARSDRDDVVATLINAAVRVGQRLAAQGRDEASRVMEQVDHHSAELVTRIGYLVLSEAGQHLPERVDRVLRSNELRSPGVPATEIAVLLRSQFRNASPEVRNEYAAAVESGPNREALSTGLRSSYGRDPTQEEIDDRVHHYQRRILTYFRGDIPEELRDLAERLGALGVTPSHQAQQLAEVGWSSGEAGRWLGEESPIGAEELAQSSADEVVAFLGEWSPGEGIGSSFGLQGTLATYAKENPGTALTVLNGALRQGVDPRATEGIVDGLGDAANAGSALDWAAALAGAQRILSRVHLLDLGRDADVGQWRRTAGCAARLIKEGCDRNSVAHELADEVWAILGEAMAVPAIWEVPHGNDKSLASVVMAKLNDAAGHVANAVIAAVLWEYRSLLRDEQQASAEAKAAARAAVQKQLALLLDRWLRDDGPNAAVLRAVVGDYVPQLHLLAPEWIEDHADHLFERGLEDPASQPTWTTYISRCNLYDEVFRATRPWYLKAAEKAVVWREAAGDSVGSREITQSYAEHLIVAVLRGLVSIGDKDALLETAYENIVPSDWHRAYWGIFCAWSDADDPPPADAVRRLVRLWEWRVSELGTNPASAATVEEAKQLGWLFHTPYIPDVDIVRLGLATARLAQGQLQMYSRWDRMLSLAQADPDGTFAIAETVLLAGLRADYPHVPGEDVKRFLAHILTVGIPDTRARARRLINRLGEGGYRQLKDLLDKNGGASG